MIEEAAGTKTYDVKKANALQTIDKKNSKLNEIERVLREDITPVIEKLKQERSAYIEYQKCEREYLHLHKISIAHQYYNHEETLKKNQSEQTELEETMKKNTDRIEEINGLIEGLKVEIGGLMKNMNAGDDLMVKLEAELKENQIEATKLNSEINSIKSNVNAERKRRTGIEKNIKDNRNMIETKQLKLDEMKNTVEAMQSDFAAAEANLKKAQQEYEALCCGFVIDEESNQLQTAQDQLLNIKNKLSEHKTMIKKAEIK